jgi:fumarate reductase subunit D
MRRTRAHPAWWAFIVHRVSGVALALFLPVHFVALGTAIRGDAMFEDFLRWSDQPLVKAAEWILVTLLAAHMAGGLRILALELMPWRNWQKTLATFAAAFAIVAGLVFALAR